MEKITTLRDGLAALMAAFPRAACQIAATAGNFGGNVEVAFQAYTDALPSYGTPGRHGASRPTIAQAVADLIDNRDKPMPDPTTDVNDDGAEVTS